jgi:hypothetical protein
VGGVVANSDVARRPPAAVSPKEQVLASFESFLMSSADVMEALGAFVGQSGRFEMATGITMEAMGKAMLETDIGKLLEAMGPDVAPLFVRVSLRLGAINSADPGKLGAEDRIKLGDAMKELSSDMRRLIEAVKAAAQRAGGA